MLMEFLAGVSCLAFLGSVVYACHLIAEEQEEAWKK